MIRIITMFFSFLTFGDVQLATVTMTNIDEYTYETREEITLDDLFGSYEMPISDLNTVDTSKYQVTPTTEEMNTWYGLYETAISTDQHEYTYVMNSIGYEHGVIIFCYIVIWVISFKFLKWFLGM